MIRKAAIRTKGGLGPSGMDADSWRRISPYNNFGTSSSDLLKAFLNVVNKLCTDLVETHTIEAFLSCHFISKTKTQDFQLLGLVKFYEESLVKLLFRF